MHVTYCVNHSFTLLWLGTGEQILGNLCLQISKNYMLTACCGSVASDSFNTVEKRKDNPILQRQQNKHSKGNKLSETCIPSILDGQEIDNSIYYNTRVHKWIAQIH